MDAASRYSKGGCCDWYICDSTIRLFETLWISPFCHGFSYINDTSSPCANLHVMDAHIYTYYSYRTHVRWLPVAELVTHIITGYGPRDVQILRKFEIHRHRQSPSTQQESPSILQFSSIYIYIYIKVQDNPAISCLAMHAPKNLIIHHMHSSDCAKVSRGSVKDAHTLTILPHLAPIFMSWMLIYIYILLIPNTCPLTTGSRVGHTYHNPFWTPKFFLFDPSFINSDSPQHLKKYFIEARWIPLSR